MQEHQYPMDMEALVDTLRAEEKEKAKFTEIQKQHEDVDKWREEHAQKFIVVDYNENIEEQIGISVSARDEISFFSDSVQLISEKMLRFKGFV